MEKHTDIRLIQHKGSALGFKIVDIHELEYCLKRTKTTPNSL